MKYCWTYKHAWMNGSTHRHTQRTHPCTNSYYTIYPGEALKWTRCLYFICRNGLALAFFFFFPNLSGLFYHWTDPGQLDKWHLMSWPLSYILLFITMEEQKAFFRTRGRDRVRIGGRLILKLFPWPVTTYGSMLDVRGVRNNTYWALYDVSRHECVEGYNNLLEGM